MPHGAKANSKALSLSVGILCDLSMIFAALNSGRSGRFQDHLRLGLPKKSAESI